MNILELSKKYQIELEKASNVLDWSIYTIKGPAGKRDIKQLTVNQLVSLHKAFNIPYNVILGEKVFTPQNIDTQPDNELISKSYFNKEELFALKELAKNKLQENSLF